MVIIGTVLFRLSANVNNFIKGPCVWAEKLKTFSSNVSPRVNKYVSPRVTSTLREHMGSPSFLFFSFSFFVLFYYLSFCSD